MTTVLFSNEFVFENQQLVRNSQRWILDCPVACPLGVESGIATPHPRMNSAFPTVRPEVPNGAASPPLENGCRSFLPALGGWLCWPLGGVFSFTANLVRIGNCSAQFIPSKIQIAFSAGGRGPVPRSCREQLLQATSSDGSSGDPLSTLQPHNTLQQQQ